MLESSHISSIKNAQQLQNWYTTAAGQILCDELKAKLEQVLPSLFGYYALQLGAICKDVDLLGSNKIGKKIYMMEDSISGHLAGSPLALPFQEDSLDLIVLPHTLDFSSAPHQVLREVHRVLISEGHLVLVAFNPISFMGLSKLAFLRSKKIPWSGHFYTARRLKDWLSLLDFTVLDVQHVGFRPPVQNLRMQERLAFLNKTKHFGISQFGGIQIFVAQKRVLTLTPRPQPWRPRRRMIPVNVAEPTARQVSHARSSRDLH